MLKFVSTFDAPTFPRHLRIDTAISEKKRHLIKALVRHGLDLISLTYHHATITPYYSLCDILHPVRFFVSLTHLDLNFMPLPGFGLGNFCEKIVNMHLMNLKSLTLEIVWQARAMKRVVKQIVKECSGISLARNKGRETYWHELSDEIDVDQMAGFLDERDYTITRNGGKGLPVLDKVSIFAPLEDIVGTLVQLPFEAKTIQLNCVPVSGGQSTILDPVSLKEMECLGIGQILTIASIQLAVFSTLRSFSWLRHLVVISPVTTIDFDNRKCIQPQDWYDKETILADGYLARQILPRLKTLEYALKIHPRLLTSSSPFPSPHPIVCHELSRWHQPSQAFSRRWESQQSFMSGHMILCTLRLHLASLGKLRLSQLNYKEFKTFRRNVCVNADFEDISDNDTTAASTSIMESKHKDCAPGFAPFNLMSQVVTALHILQDSADAFIFDAMMAGALEGSN